MSWSWRYKTLEANSKSPPWGRWECQPTRWWEPFWDPNTRARWTSEPTSSLWRRRTSNKTRYQDCQTFDLSSLMVSKPPSVFPVWMKSFSGIKSVFIQKIFVSFDSRCSLLKLVTGVRTWRPCQAWRAARRCSTQAAELSESAADEWRWSAQN